MFQHVSHLKVVTLTLECAMRDELHGTCHAETRSIDVDELRAVDAPYARFHGTVCERE